MTVLSLPDGPPTRGPVMNFSKSTARGPEERKKKKRKSRSAAAVSPAPLTCTEAAPRDYATRDVTRSAAANRGRIPRPRALREPRPSANGSAAAGKPVHRGTWPGGSVHVSGTGKWNTVVVSKRLAGGAPLPPNPDSTHNDQNR